MEAQSLLLKKKSTLRFMQRSNQSGQTIIETVVAIFILVTALISAVGLATYALRSSGNSSLQVIATTLARESIEGIKNKRDTNWLSVSPGLTPCYAEIGPGQECYKNWLGTGQNKLDPGNYAFDFVPSSNDWKLISNPSSYVLRYDPATGAYSSDGAGSNSIFSRKVNIVHDTSSPYTAQDPRLIIVSTVWWSGRQCPSTTDPTTLPASCKIVLEMHLTNWRNY